MTPIEIFENWLAGDSTHAMIIDDYASYPAWLFMLDRLSREKNPKNRESIEKLMKEMEENIFWWINEDGNGFIQAPHWSEWIVDMKGFKQKPHKNAQIKSWL